MIRGVGRWGRRTAGVLGLSLAAVAFELARFKRWFARETNGMAFFGRTAGEREAFAAEVREQGRWVVPLMTGPARAFGGILPNGVNFNGTTAPPQCGRSDFQRAVHYQPQPTDVFVVTQMKCGTTWMMQLVYEVLSHGHGDLSDTGGRHIYGVASWIEASWAQPLGAAPELGDSRSRMIKSHLPASLLPIDDRARYIYVTRHPAACFASCVDFINTLIGAVAPERARLLAWFCSDRMWWGSWPDHVAGWWDAAQDRPNVLFVHFEEMLDDLGAVVDKVAAHCGIVLTGEERASVVRKSTFAYMKEHEERFTMSPPTAFQKDRIGFLRSAGASSRRELPPGERERIATFCRDRLAGSRYPLARFYPDLADTASVS